jgi:hypothetical protein
MHKIKFLSKSQLEIKKHTFYNHTVLEKFIYCGRMRTGNVDSDKNTNQSACTKEKRECEKREGSVTGPHGGMGR